MPEPRGCENQVGPKARRLVLAMNRLFTEIARDNDLGEMSPVSGRIMGFIYFSEKDVFQKDVEEAFRITRSSVTSAVKLMEKKGYILREPVPGDARLKKLTLTERGVHVHETAMRAMREAEERTCLGITEEEKKTFMRVCDKLTQNAENRSREGITA